MSDKYLILGFKGAGFFNNKKTKDFVFDIKGQRKRSETKFYTEPINVNHISNVLHVLFGERPKPSLRHVLFKEIDYYRQKALKSYLRIDSYKRMNKSKNKEEFVEELMRTKKSIFNAYSTAEFMYWERARKILGDELFDEFLNVLSKIFNKKNIQDVYSFEEAKQVFLSGKYIKKPLIDKFLNKLIDNKKASVVGYFKDTNNNSVNFSRNSLLTINSGIEKISRLDGEIIVPITDSDIERLKNSKGCATILDGGLVYIKGIQTANKIILDNHIPVKEISTKTY